MRILVVEDEQVIAADICHALSALGYVAETVTDGNTAWELGGTENFAAIVLDLGLPHMDGLTILKQWRSEGVTTPVLILTARGAWTERVDGIDAGADDYLPKPFQMEELLARLRALIRRSTEALTPVLTIGDLTLDTRQMRVAANGVPIALSPLEFRLVSYLMHHSSRVVSQAELAEALYSHTHDREPNAIEALIGRVRRKIPKELIRTHRGFGYSIKEPFPP